MSARTVYFPSLITALNTELALRQTNQGLGALLGLMKTGITLKMKTIGDFVERNVRWMPTMVNKIAGNPCLKNIFQVLPNLYQKLRILLIYIIFVEFSTHFLLNVFEICIFSNNEATWQFGMWHVTYQIQLFVRKCQKIFDYFLNLSSTYFQYFSFDYLLRYRPKSFRLFFVCLYSVNRKLITQSLKDKTYFIF
jgi:hypothetical protein